MSEFAVTLPVCRRDLVIRALGDHGPYVVKDPGGNDYFQIGESEHFLLGQFVGSKTAAEICAAYAGHFGEVLAEEDLEQFVTEAQAQGLLQADDGKICPMASRRPGASSWCGSLCWRKKILDPDRLFTLLAPRISFFWTRGFLAFSASCILLAMGLLWTGGSEFSANLAQILHWESAVLIWITITVITMLHEFAHGLTCRHFGGEVHDIGFMLLFFLPCFYCDVSDAWLFREKSKRLWVTFAGAYFELFLWALAVFVWRLTLPGTMFHYLALVVLSVTGVQTLLNFVPLLKLDGYYLLSDWLEIPNLHQASLDSFKDRARQFLWDAPGSADRQRGLLVYLGFAVWLFSVVFLVLSCWALFRFLGSQWGWIGIAVVAAIGWLSVRHLVQGFSGGEVSKMIRQRHQRTVAWLLTLAALGVGLFVLRIDDWASGTLHLRSVNRVELRAPAAAFLKEVHVDEGDRVSPGTLIARLEVPDRTSCLARKQAEVREVQARLKLLEAGPRTEEVAEQKNRVERAKAWCDLARKDLERLRKSVTEVLASLEKQITAFHADLEVATSACKRAQVLLNQRALAEAQYQDALGKQRASFARWEQVQAEKRAYEAKGTFEAEAELARREKELADAQACFNLLLAGTRSEEIDAERARLNRLQEEARYLSKLGNRLLLVSSISGVVSTVHLKEKVGQHLKEGELLCVVEDRGVLAVEVTLLEQDAARVQPGQSIRLKARALPYESFAADVERKAPVAAKGETQGTVTVYGRLRTPPDELQPGMTGHARICTGRRPVGIIACDRALRYLRTEFWWW